MVNDLIKQLGIDQTLWIQFAVFIVFYAWLRFVFFPPFLRLMSAREAKTSGLVAEVEELNQRASASELELSQKMAQVQREAAQEREKTIADAKAKAHAMLDGARKDAKKRIEEARIKAEAAQVAELASLSQQARDLGDLFVEKLTQEKAGSR